MQKKKELALALRANLYRRKKIKNTDVINKNQENNDVDKK